MKRFLLAACLFGITAGMFVAPEDRTEVRVLWVVRTSLTSPAAIEELVADAKAAGINTLIIQVRGRADAYYRSCWR